MRRAIGWMLLGLSLPLQGCYAHRPVRPEEVPVGASVRARVTAGQSERLGEVLGRTDRVLVGRVVAEEPGGLLVQVPVSGAGTGQPLRQQVVLPPSEIVELEVRRLDRPRTFALVAALAVAGGAIIAQQLGEGTDDPSGPPKPGGGDQALLPFRWYW